jgi:hypothetical protein
MNKKSEKHQEELEKIKKQIERLKKSQSKPQSTDLSNRLVRDTFSKDDVWFLEIMKWWDYFQAQCLRHAEGTRKRSVKVQPSVPPPPLSRKEDSFPHLNTTFTVYNVNDIAIDPWLYTRLQLLEKYPKESADSMLIDKNAVPFYRAYLIAKEKQSNDVVKFMEENVLKKKARTVEGKVTYATVVKNLKSALQEDAVEHGKQQVKLYDEYDPSTPNPQNVDVVFLRGFIKEPPKTPSIFTTKAVDGKFKEIA